MNLKHTRDGSSVVRNDEEQKSTGFLHGDLVWDEALVPTVLQLRVVERDAVLAVNNKFTCTIKRLVY